MDIKIRVIKKRAGNALNGNMGNAILGMLAVFAAHLAGSLLASSLFAGTDTLSLILNQVFLFIISLIAAIVSAGMSYMYLNIARQKDYSLADLFYFFKNQPDRVIVAAFVMALIDLLVTIPYYYYEFTADVGETLEQQTTFMMVSLMLLLIASALNTVLTSPFALTYYLLSENQDMDGLTALRQSAQLMKGNLIRFLLMLLSFVPVMLLSVFTMYIALLWIIPYMDMSRTVFYIKLLEYRERELEEHNQWISSQS